MAEEELVEVPTCKEFLQVQMEGNQVGRKRKFYNLNAIISVGYRVHSQVTTRFRIWATQRLKEYIVKRNQGQTTVSAQQHKSTYPLYRTSYS